MYKIVLWDGCKWFGKFKSSFSLFEIVFETFVLVISRNRDYLVAKISFKKNTFLKNIREGNEVLSVKKWKSIDIGYFKYLDMDSTWNKNFLFYEKSFYFKMNNSLFEVQDFFVMSGYILFIFEEHIVIFSFDCNIYSFNEENYEEYFKSIIEMNGFNFFYRGETINDIFIDENKKDN